MIKIVSTRDIVINSKLNEIVPIKDQSDNWNLVQHNKIQKYKNNV